jgi:hypothetical protein
MTESMPWQPKRSKMHVCTCKFVVSFRTAKMCLLPWLHRRFGSTMHDPFSDWDLKSHPRRESPFLPLNHITQFPTSVFQYVCFKEKRALEIANELVGTKKDRLSLESVRKKAINQRFSSAEDAGHACIIISATMVQVPISDTPRQDLGGPGAIFPQGRFCRLPPWTSSNLPNLRSCFHLPSLDQLPAGRQLLAGQHRSQEMHTIGTEVGREGG